ncbi:amino acid adenylation domain-containing protein [Streptomyces sp. LP05-1]|uniref:Amino acid adenylation domain-containing protein n=1 Tax=Streptomyces pyxinae TaxID=2970734 RepID=A0ABT2CJI9_9ACTN|nr:non-ribosomal peptide synthetase [Streptomyces sp. LP05-1]MCS0637585.1 amino acid adenylation domain-containing protein [Streptomyces sp. LP05-1]
MPAPDPGDGLRPLLAAQEGIWTGQQLDPDSPAYNTAEYVRIAGAVDPAAFERALRHTVAEVAAVQVRFPVDAGGRPRELAVPVPDWAPHHADLTAAADPHGAALAWMADDLARPTDLARGPLFGHALLRTGPAEYLWYHRVHHIALDGFGLALVARRVAHVYTALLAGEPPGESGFGTLESVRHEEAAYRASARYAEDRAYWTRRFADRPAVTGFAGRSALPARSFLRRITDLGAEETAALRAAARELSVTWSDLLLGITAGYLHRVTGAPEAVLGLPVMGRLGSVSLRVPCMVRNVLPLRIPGGGRDSPRELAARAAAELRACLPHQRYRYEQLRRDLKLVGGGRRLSGPGVNIMPFEYDLRFAGLPSTVHNLSAGPVDDLSVNVYDRAEGAGLRIAVDAHPGLYDEVALAGHQRGLLDLLREAVAAPDRPLTRRPSPATPGGGGPQPLVLDGGPLPGPAVPVVRPLTDHAARRGAAVAVEEAGRSLDYAGLYAAARRLAARLAARGVGPGDLVAVVLPRGTGTVVAVLGVLLSGAAYCPLDPDAPASRTEALLASARPAAVLTTGDRAARFPGLPVLTPGAPEPGAPEPGPADRWPPEPGPDDLAYVIHTSGTTGTPKGVEISHGALAAFVAGARPRYGLRPADRVLQFAPPHFDTSVEELFLTLATGATLVVRDPAMTDSVPAFLDACDRLRISVLDLPTAYWHEVAHAVSTGIARLPAGVRTVVIGGEAALPERVDRWRAAVDPSVRLLNTYGPTEATVVATVADLHDPAADPGDVPIGHPLPGMRAVVADGELYLTGAALARGYRGAAAPDDARFAPLAQLPGAPRAFRTGDRVRVGDDGQLRFLGRADDEFKISGHRVHPAEVEAALLTDARVREAAVVGQVLPDGTRRLAAHVVAAGPQPAAAELRSRLRELLPAAMVPSAVEFTDRLPRTSTGKIDRKALAAVTGGRTADPATVVDPATGAPRGPEEAVGPVTGSAPVTVAAGDPLERASVPDPLERAAAPDGAGDPLERTIGRLWAQVLGIERLNRDDDFFDLGAQSLQAIQVANRLGVELAREVRVGWLFEHPTVAGLARRLAPPPAAPGEPGTDAGAAADTAATGPDPAVPVPAGAAPADAVRADAAPAGPPDMAAAAGDARDARDTGDTGGAVPGLPPALSADAVLAGAIRPAVPARRAGARAPGAPRTVLLTGATGFVGPHLLAELLRVTDAEIICPVRAADPAGATERILGALAAQGLPRPAGAERITALPADLARPDLGLGAARLTELADRCDAVFHNAATVSVLREYTSLRAVNTGATHRLLRLAAARAVPLHLVSTLSVAPPRSLSPEVPEAFFPPHPGLLRGYQQSKWASERLVEQAAERGLPVTVHRLGRVVGAPATGLVNPRDFLWSVLAAGLPAGLLPELFEAEVWTPVDYVARAVVRLSLSGAPGTVFNHAPVEPVRLDDLYDWVAAYGYAVKRVPTAQWRAELPRSPGETAAVAVTTGAFFDSLAGAEESGRHDGGDGPELGLGRVRADHVRRGLDGTGIGCPVIDRALVFRYLDHGVRTGMLPPPGGREG